MHNLVTDVKCHLKPSYVAGLPIGHVPQKKLKPCFRRDLDNAV